MFAFTAIIYSYHARTLFKLIFGYRIFISAIVYVTTHEYHFEVIRVFVKRTEMLV